VTSSLTLRAGALAALPAPVGTRLLLGLALLVTAAGAVALVPAAVWPDAGAPGPLTFGYLALLIALFAGTALLLLLGGRRSRRSLYWGGVLLLSAAGLSSRPLLVVAGGGFPEPLGLAAKLVTALPLDLFVPALLWRFLLHFAELPPEGEARRRLQRGERLCWAGGLTLLALHGWNLVTGSAGSLGQLAAATARHDPASLYFPLLAAGALPALALLAWGARRYRGPLGSRSRPFLWGTLLGSTPAVVGLALRPLLIRLGIDPGPVLLPLSVPLVLVPLATVWGTRAGRLFALPRSGRRQICYSALRTLFAAGTATPPVLLTAFAYQQRHQSLEELATSLPFVALGLLALLAMILLGYRRPLLLATEQRLFPEQTQRPLSEQRLVEKLRACSTGEELGAILERELSGRLALEDAALLLRTSDGQLVHPAAIVRPLAATSELATRLGRAETLAVDLEDPASPLRNLPEEERHWLVDSGASLVLALSGAKGQLLGLLLLHEEGEVLSGWALELLEGLAGPAALALDLVLERQAARLQDRVSVPPMASAAPARECPRCGRVYPSASLRCGRCDRPLMEIPLPQLLPGRLRIQRRIGTGRMGVIYRASDLALGRQLAVKTLPRMAPEDALRLRREARTAAAVSHPNLEVIYGVETWRGTPMILLELLEGGTLRQRLRRGVMEPAEALSLGIQLAEALEHLHGRGILHRDVKPGNIAYTGAGVPKLVDFDLARVLHDPRSDSWDAVPTRTPTPASKGSSSSVPSVHRTDWLESLYYRSPETITRQTSTPASDLWSLHAVLFECLTGSRLFNGRRLGELLRCLAEQPIPELEAKMTHCPAALGAYFRRALDRDPHRRPSSASEALAALAALAADLPWAAGGGAVSTAPPAP
jgi:hypothetical protein